MAEAIVEAKLAQDWTCEVLLASFENFIPGVIKNRILSGPPPRNYNGAFLRTNWYSRRPAPSFRCIRIHPLGRQAFHSFSPLEQ